MNGVLQFFFVFFGSVYFAKNSGNQCKLKEVVQLFSVFLCVVATMGIQMGNMRFMIFIPSHHLAILFPITLSMNLSLIFPSMFFFLMLEALGTWYMTLLNKFRKFLGQIR